MFEAIILIPVEADF